MCLVQVGYLVAVTMTLLGGAAAAPDDECLLSCNVTIANVVEVEPDSACVVNSTDTYNSSYCLDALKKRLLTFKGLVKHYINKDPYNVTLGEEALSKTIDYFNHVHAAMKEPKNYDELKDVYCGTKLRVMKLTLLMRLVKQRSKLPPEAFGTSKKHGQRNSTEILLVLRNMSLEAKYARECREPDLDTLNWVRNLQDKNIYDALTKSEEDYLWGVHTIKVLRRLVQPVLSAGMFILGAFFNILMLSIFVRCPESRAPRNMILLQLAVGDMLSLTVNLPVYHTVVLLDLFPGKRGTSEHQDKFFEFVRYMCFSIGIFSIVALCFQRYCATLKLTDRGMILRQSTKYSSILVISTVWLCAIAISVYHAFLCIRRDCFAGLGENTETHRLTYILDFLFLALAPFLLISILSALTARHFQKRLAQLKISLPPDAWEKLRQSLARSTTVLRLTPVVFGISFIPFYLLHVTVVLGASINSVWYNCCYVLAYVLIFLQTCFNPISTYVTSSTFRGYLHSYIFYKRYDQTYSFDLQPENLREHPSIPEEGELQRFRLHIPKE